MYFKKFPIIPYEFIINGETVVRAVRDVTLNVRIRRDVLSSITLYDSYDIQDGDTPEIIAAKVYGSPLYHWVVMLTNETFDYINDFPLSDRDLLEYATEKYGANLYSIKHYQLADGSIVLPGTFGATAVTNWDYEQSVNESKRRIKILHPDAVPQLVNQLEQFIK